MPERPPREPPRRTQSSKGLVVRETPPAIARPHTLPPARTVVFQQTQVEPFADSHRPFTDSELQKVLLEMRNMETRLESRFVAVHSELEAYGRRLSKVEDAYVRQGKIEENIGRIEESIRKLADRTYEIRTDTSKFDLATIAKLSEQQAKLERIDAIKSNAKKAGWVTLLIALGGLLVEFGKWWISTKPPIPIP